MSKISKEKLIEMYINEEKSFRTIALELNIGKTTVEYYLKKYEIPTRNNLEIIKKNNYKNQKWIKGLTKENDERVSKLPESIKKTYKRKRIERIKLIEKKYNQTMYEILKELYINQELNLNQIGKKIGFHRTIISSLIDEYKIPKRNRYYKISKLKGENHSQYGKSWEKVRGVEKSRIDKKNMSIIARKNIIRRLENNEIPFKDTKIEKIMEENLLLNKIRFEKQYSIDNKYVCDFAIIDAKIIVECDGDYWHANPELYIAEDLDNRQIQNIFRDNMRNIYLQKKGWKVLRFFESEIKKDISNCIKQIKKNLE